MEEFVKKWSSQFKKGTLSFIVLSLLRKKEYYGYELIEEVSKTMQFEIAEGTLYPLLNRLNKAGLVEFERRPQLKGVARKYYTITEAGKRSLKEMSKVWLDMNMNIQKLLMDQE